MACALLHRCDLASAVAAHVGGLVDGFGAMRTTAVARRYTAAGAENQKQQHQNGDEEAQHAPDKPIPALAVGHTIADGPGHNANEEQNLKAHQNNFHHAEISWHEATPPPFST